MKQHGMLYKGEMVCKIQDTVAPKTQTRRPITFSNSITEPRVKRKEWPDLRWAEAYIIPEMIKCMIGGCLHFTHVPVWHMPYKDWQVKVYPRIRPGDVIWVKETYLATDCAAEQFTCKPSEIVTTNAHVYYRANLGLWGRLEEHPDYPHASGYKWKSSMLMHRWASRIDLLVLGMRSERVQEISEVDAQAEGWTRRPDITSDPQVHKEAARDWFMDLWDSINTGRGFPWAGNHPVWIHDFERMEG